MTAQDHALRLLTARKMDPSPRNLTDATRRVVAAGRLAGLGGHMVPGLLRAVTIEHGDADAMATGSMVATCWLDARDDTEWRLRAGQLLGVEDIAASKGVRLTVAIYRATRWTRLGAWLRWQLFRVLG